MRVFGNERAYKLIVMAFDSFKLSGKGSVMRSSSDGPHPLSAMMAIKSKASRLTEIRRLFACNGCILLEFI